MQASPPHSVHWNDASEKQQTETIVAKQQQIETILAHQQGPRAQRAAAPRPHPRPPQQQLPYSEKSEEPNTRNFGSQVEDSAADQLRERSSENDDESGLRDKGTAEDREERVRKRREADLKASAESRMTLEKMQKMEIEQTRDQENMREAARRRDKELKEEEKTRRQEQRLMGKYVR